MKIETSQIVVVIPVYRKTLLPDEVLSLKQALQVLSRYRIVLVCPDRLDLAEYNDVTGIVLPVERFASCFFEGIEGYNKLMCSMDFYERFKKYVYMLIYQLDAWVFSDQLQHWCNQEYDYIGAPWFGRHKTYEEGENLWAVGNGGFSLRRVAKFLQVCNPKSKVKSLRQYVCECPSPKYLFREISRYFRGRTMKQHRESKSYLWEDVYFSLGLDDTQYKMKTPSPEEAALFSMECSPRYLYFLVGQTLPFGCHGWRKYQYDDFWCQFIPTRKHEL